MSHSNPTDLRPDLNATRPVDQHLLRIVSRRVPPEIGAWLARAIGAVRTAETAERFFGEALVVLGTTPAWLDPEERFVLERDGGPSSLVGWSLDTCARVAMILRVLDEMPASEHGALLDRLSRLGGRRGETAVLRAVRLLPDAPRRVRALAG